VLKSKGLRHPVDKKWPIFSLLGHSKSDDVDPVCDQEVNWAMEVICHGLCLPLTDHEIIRDCVSIYCEWLSALLPNPKICVPRRDSFCSFIHLLIYDDHMAIRRCSGDRYRYKNCNFPVQKIGTVRYSNYLHS
jgi:hypothetical protein